MEKVLYWLTSLSAKVYIWCIRKQIKDLQNKTYNVGGGITDKHIFIYKTHELFPVVKEALRLPDDTFCVRINPASSFVYTTSTNKEEINNEH